jgi:hypothetical protein
LTGRVYFNGSTHNRCPIDAGDKGFCVGSLGADADGAPLASNTPVADIDIAVARGEAVTSLNAQCDIEVASGIAKKRATTSGRVKGAGCVVFER